MKAITATKRNTVSQRNAGLPLLEGAGLGTSAVMTDGDGFLPQPCRTFSNGIQAVAIHTILTLTLIRSNHLKLNYQSLRG